MRLRLLAYLLICCEGRLVLSVAYGVARRSVAYGVARGQRGQRPPPLPTAAFAVRAVLRVARAASDYVKVLL